MADWTISSVASAWGLVMALAPVLQIVRMLRLRSSEDVSLGYFWLLLPGFLLWVAHGYTTGDAFLMIPNAAAAVTAVCLIVVATRLRSDRTSSQHDMPDHRRSS
ncbi:SemiSWEET family sugar transporter [Brachybacterium fresconis]|uniref:SemiSWEET family sugar transporter n=1 Tax=Brachybacterium fresconis TaxID=173363 RepID=UPI00315B2291